MGSLGRKTDPLWERVGGSGEARRSRGGWEDKQLGEESEGLSLPFPSLPGLPFPPNTNVAVVHPNAMSIIFAVTFHRIVGEVTLCYFKIGVDDHLRGGERQHNSKVLNKHSFHLLAGHLRPQAPAECSFLASHL